MSIDSENFIFFRQLSFLDIFAKLNTVKKIQQSIYYQSLESRLQKKTSLLKIFMMILIIFI